MPGTGLDLDRQPHQDTKAIFTGKARGRDGQPRVPPLDRHPSNLKSEARLGSRKDWFKETSSDGPDSASATTVWYSGLDISLRMLKGLQYRLTVHLRSWTADTVGWGAALRINDGTNDVKAVLGPKVTAANVGEGGGTYSWVEIPTTTAFVRRRVGYDRISGSGTGHAQATGLSPSWFMIEVVGNDDLIE